MFSQITILGADIRPGDVISRLPGVPVASGADVDPRYPHSRTLTMADGSLYFCDPQQTYTIARPTEPVAPVDAPRMLVVGPVADDDERADLTMFAKDVSAELGCSATVADSLDFDVREFVAVVVDQDYLSSVTASVLWIEAVEAGVPVIEPQAPALAARCDACSQLQTITTVRDTSGGITEVLCATCDGRAPGCCSWCLEEGPTAPVHDGAGTWAPLCKWCAKECKRRARRGAGGRRPVAAGCAA